MSKPFNRFGGNVKVDKQICCKKATSVDISAFGEAS